jgi:hypothetical protein
MTRSPDLAIVASRSGHRVVSNYVTSTQRIGTTAPARTSGRTAHRAIPALQLLVLSVVPIIVVAAGAAAAFTAFDLWFGPSLTRLFAALGFGG